MHGSKEYYYPSTGIAQSGLPVGDRQDHHVPRAIWGMDGDGVAGLAAHDSPTDGGFPADFFRTGIGFVFPDNLPRFNGPVLVLEFNPGTE